jgi:precorrin-6B methylase 1
LLYGATGPVAGNYTVDLGELNPGYINQSNGAAVIHSDAVSGVINSIYLDLTTNALGGATVIVTSANQGLNSATASEITSVAANGDPIVAGSGKYGFTIAGNSSLIGTVNNNSACTISTAFCRLLTAGTEVFNSNSGPLDTGRVRFDLAAAAAAANISGTYTDTLTFIAIPTY